MKLFPKLASNDRYFAPVTIPLPKPLTPLEEWLAIATGDLCDDVVERVTDEIQEHYATALEDALRAGMAHPDAEREALLSLGSAQAAARRLSAIHITKSEIKFFTGRSWWAVTITTLSLGPLLSIPMAVLASRVQIRGDNTALGLLLAGPIIIAIFACWLQWMKHDRRSGYTRRWVVMAQSCMIFLAFSSLAITCTASTITKTISLSKMPAIFPDILLVSKEPVGPSLIGLATNWFGVLLFLALSYGSLRVLRKAMS
jgi:hypothetical protein